MRHTFRLGRGWLPVLGATAALAVIPSVASAGTGGGGGVVDNHDPQTTNVPYLAWNGEEIRLEKCVPLEVDYADAATTLGVDNPGKHEFQLGSSYDPDFLVEDWSGTAQTPQVERNTVGMFVTDDYDGNQTAVCFQGDVVSLHEGLARVQLVVSEQDWNILGELGIEPGDPSGQGSGPIEVYLKHQFLAGWMKLNDPSLSEMGSADFPGSAASTIGDPDGTGSYTAGDPDGYLRVNVTGTLPSGGWDGLSGDLTLPNDWVKMAHALATDTDPTDSSPWNMWDTSGDNNNTEGHVVGTPPCKPDYSGLPTEATGPDSYLPVLDNGDNCTGGDEYGPFSTAFGLSSDEVEGPFDPTQPSATDLPDGNLSSLDAPMPAARVDVSIAPHTAGSTDGVGSLEPADKTVTYSRDFSGDSAPHNLYAPFYDAFIPATARDTAASSGIDGGYANNFNGFLGWGDYHFWKTFRLAQRTKTATKCLDRTYSGARSESDNPAANPGDYQQTPSGDTSDAVYTDQNGEAQVRYNPGTGFYFDNLPVDDTTGIIYNPDGGCDLQNLLGKEIGTSSISATARYPYKPVDDLPTQSGSVEKHVISQWSKTLANYPKGTGAENSAAEIVVAHAQDITGRGYANETVCFASDGESLVPFYGSAGGYSYGGATLTDDPYGQHTGRTCLNTDDYGNAAVVVIESQPKTVDVVADFTEEGILRRDEIAFPGNGQTPPTGGTGPTQGAPEGGGGTTTTTTTTSTETTTTVAASSPTQSSTSGTTAPPPSVVAKVMPKLVAKKSPKAHPATIEIARLVTPAHGRHYLVIRVNSSSSRARVLLTLRVRQGHRLHTVQRTITVNTNRTIKANVSKSVKKIKGAHLS